MKKSNIIAIASGKGGVGKTWLSNTLAHAFANSGRKALLFDGDIGLANVDVQLGLQPDVDLSHVFTGKATLAQAITHFQGGNFDVIAGRSGTGSLAQLPIGKITALRTELEVLAKDYDIVLLDLGAGVEQHVQALAALAEKCLVVVTDEPTSLTDAYAFIKILRMQKEHQPEIQIVVNMAENGREGLQTFNAIKNACENFLKFAPKLCGVIRRDPKVKKAIQAQTPILSMSSKAVAAADVAAIAVKLMAK